MVITRFLIKAVFFSCLVLGISHCDNSIDEMGNEKTKEIIEETPIDTMKLHGFLLRDHWIDTSKVEPNQ